MSGRKLGLNDRRGLVGRLALRLELDAGGLAELSGDGGRHRRRTGLEDVGLDLEDLVDDAERLSLQVRTVVVGKVVDTTAQDVILRNDLFNVISVLEAL
jgi:hypothetical protein